ncbi:MAG TPA: type 1 glutamine amidotransferase domain-containing protein [Candidatus Sulfotelmatobacter sp.]|nr:type 1 glutamine amidotransferase domain-containing protein [Candidatus Sulfotelmatobacter sp.]
MHTDLEDKRVAILAMDGFEQSELEDTRAALEEAGADTYVISPTANSIKAWNKDGFGDIVAVDVRLADTSVDEFDALLLPGGVMNPDKLRTVPEAVDFVRAFFEAGKPVAAICHGPQMLIEAEVVHGRKMTSFHSIKTDLINAGALWTNENVVVDHGLITAQKPADIPAFNKKMIEEFAAGIHAGQHA